jgi:hypothetical protein
MSRLTRIAALAGFALAAAAPTIVAADTIKIGVNQPLTGAVAASGNYVTNGAKIAADEINANGGLLGQQVELIIEDNKSNPTEAVAAAEKLIARDEVPVMMGAWSSTFTLAVMPKLMEYGVPMVARPRPRRRSRPRAIPGCSASRRPRRWKPRRSRTRSTSSTSRRPISWSSTTTGGAARRSGSAIC